MPFKACCLKCNKVFPKKKKRCPKCNVELTAVNIRAVDLKRMRNKGGVKR